MQLIQLTRGNTKFNKIINIIIILIVSVHLNYTNNPLSYPTPTKNHPHPFLTSYSMTRGKIKSR